MLETKENKKKRKRENKGMGQDLDGTHARNVGPWTAFVAGDAAVYVLGGGVSPPYHHEAIAAHVSPLDGAVFHDHG
jgi:hypothetical protein